MDGLMLVQTLFGLEEIEETKQCIKCGKITEVEEARYCKHCGIKLELTKSEN